MFPQFYQPHFCVVIDAENALDMPVMDDFDRIATARHVSPVVADVDFFLTGADNNYNRLLLEKVWNSFLQ